MKESYFKDIKGVVFDLDGTLYDQKILRMLMFPTLILGCLSSPIIYPPFKTLRTIIAFRKVREMLRNQPIISNLNNVQFKAVATQIGMPPETVERLIDDWVYKKPLRILSFLPRKKLYLNMIRLKKMGFKLGVFSDYPAREKLMALGFEDNFFDSVVHSAEMSVNSFKPNPDGFLRSAERLGLDPKAILYVGDRLEVDVAGARRAGMRSALIGKRMKGVQCAEDYRYVCVKNLSKLVEILETEGKTEEVRLQGKGNP